MPTSGKQYQRLSKQPWISFNTAAVLTGISIWHIKQAVDAGGIETREIPDSYRPSSLNRVSVIRWAKAWHREKAEQDAAAAVAAEEKETAARKALPPDDDHEWLSREAMADLLGVSTNRVGQLVAQGRLPHLRRAHRVWFRRDHAELYRAARQAVKSGRV